MWKVGNVRELRNTAIWFAYNWRSCSVVLPFGSTVSFGRVSFSRDLLYMAISGCYVNKGTLKEKGGVRNVHQDP